MMTTNQLINTLWEKDTKELKDKLLTILAKESYKEGKFILVSGRESNYFIDGKLTTLNAEGGAIISVLFFKMLRKEIDSVVSDFKKMK